MNVAELQINAPASWTFYPFDHFILARPDSAIGALQISTAFRHDVSCGASSSDCLALAQQFAAREGKSDSFDITETVAPAFLLGAFSYITGDEFGRVWYRYSQQQLLLATYKCPRQKSHEAAAELQDAEQIIRASDYATPST